MTGEAATSCGGVAGASRSFKHESAYVGPEAF
jgi:hypothetical protein